MPPRSSRRSAARLLRAALALSFSFAAASAALAAELKVDLNRNGQDASTTSAGYTPWSIPDPTGTTAASRTFTTADGPVTVTFARTAASAGTGLQTNWFKTNAQQNPEVNGARLVADGVTVAGGNAGGQIQMTVTGLPAGPHTLLTYHNAWDNLVAGAQGPIDISLNGTLVVDNLQPTVRAATTTATPVAYLEFEVAGPADVVTILFAAELSGTATVKNPVINGFEIDTPNAARQAQSPSPVHANEHVDADAGTQTLGWTAAPGITTHRVYFGTDFTAVKTATPASPEFKGAQAATSFPLTGLNSLLSYWWRIDEVDGSGNVTKGNVWFFRPRHLAFPGAEGYGRFARGGRGGTVVEVTSLADYGGGATPIPGTLRYAVEQVAGPRTIVFNVSGLITLGSRLTVNSPYLTIAGQTAPGKGVCLRGYTMGLSGAKDVVVRFMRARPGNISGTTIDGMGMSGSDHCIFDHCSISWSIDEAFSSRTAKNITLQRTLISEALNAAGHQNYPAGTEHGYAASVGGDIATFHHNLLAHCYGRNWSMAGGLDNNGFFSGRLDFTNNVVYNWGNRTTDGGAMEVNFVNNFYKPGAGTTHFYALTAQYDNFPGTQRYYFAGNVMPGHFDESSQELGRRSQATNGGSLPSYQNFMDLPFFPSYVTTQSAGDAFKRVLSDVGANQPLDAHDARIIQESLLGTFTYTGSYTGKPGFPDSQDDVGGWENYPAYARPASWDTDHDGLPDWWESIHGTNANSAAGDFSDANADPDGDQYTALDDYLAWMGEPHAACLAGGAVELDLRTLAVGYTASPVFGVSGAVNGAVELLADGHTARFTPAVAFESLGEFRFSVIDSAGSTMNTTIGVRVIAAPRPQLALLRAVSDYALEFAGAPGRTYTLQHSADLAAWTAWDTVVASGDAVLIAVPAELATGAKHFYRAVPVE